MSHSIHTAALMCWCRAVLWLTCIGWLLSMVPAHGQTLPEVPLVSAETEHQSALYLLYQKAQQDFLIRLPAQEALTWSDWQNGGKPVEWSQANEKFWQRCEADWSNCDDFLNRQLTALRKWLKQRSDHEQGNIEASVASLMAEACQRWTGPQSPFFEHCGLNKHLLEVALRWRNLGQDHLFFHYLRNYETHRSQYLAWLLTNGYPVSASTNDALPEVPAHVQAIASELRGDLSMARLQWLLTFGAAQENKLVQLIALTHASRLSWRLGQPEVASELAQAGVSGLNLSEKDETSLPCALRHEIWRMNLAQSRAEGTFPAEALPRLKTLISKGCPFTQGSVKWAVDWMREANLFPPDLKSVGEGLAVAVTACQQGGHCPAPRMQRLIWLMLLADSSTDAHAGVAVQLRSAWPAWSDDTGVLDIDVQLAWGTAQRMMQSTAHRAEALVVADLALNTLPGVAATNDSSAVSAQDVANAVRYDRLVRTSARWQLEAGHVMFADVLERHRAQSLMRRLRMAHLEATLRDEKLPVSQALQFDHRQAEMLTEKQKVETAFNNLPGLAGMMAQLTTDAVASLDRERLLAKARQRQLRMNPQQSKDWLRQSMGLDALQDLARKSDSLAVQRWIGGGTASLAPTEAYLTWLEVPGGWVGTVVGPRPSDEFWANSDQQKVDKDAGVVRLSDGRALSSHFVPASSAVSSALTLYRELLLSGGANQRGAKVTVSAPTDDTQGLLLQGLPVWQHADGRYVAARNPGSNVRRVNTATELAEVLSQALLAPWAVHLKGVRQLTISPDGELTKLPFETLRVGSQMLVESINIAYVQSLQVHAELKRRESNEGMRRPVSVLSVSDPDYTSKAIQPLPVREASTLASWQQDLKWKPLPGTRSESQKIQALFPRTRMLARGQATVANMDALSISGDLEGYRLLHFATHGYVDKERSALVLAPNPGWAEAYLQDVDLLRWRLKSRLVLLSACDTGLGRDALGEGVMGLPYALMLAGNMNTMMSLWSVDDEGAATFVPAYLARVAKGVPMLEAFNQTKRDFLKGEYGEKMQDPRIWSTFVMYGVEATL